MTAAFDIDKIENISLRAHYEQMAFDRLRVLWHRRFAIAGMVALAVVIALIVFVLIGPRYTAEAIIQLNFNREVPANGTRSQPTASLDAAALVDSAARLIRSRVTASATVTRLGLDKDPAFARKSISMRLLSAAQSALGQKPVTQSSHDLATSALMNQISVTNEPRSYLISVKFATTDPERAAGIANAIALEFLWGEMLRRLTDERAAAEREMAEVSSVYGERHPSFERVRTKLEHLQARLSAVRDGASTEHVATVVEGQSLLAADKIAAVPSGPSIALVLGLAAAAALVAAMWLIVLREQRLFSPDQLAGNREQVLG